MRLATTSLVRMALALSCALSGLACSVPRQVHDPVEYSSLDLACSSLELEVLDGRADVPGHIPRDTRQLHWPREFEQQARERLLEMVGGTGPVLRVVARVASADEFPLVDARGEMTRVVVTLNFDIQIKDGQLLRRAEAQSISDIPRHEATPDEIDFVLRSTAMNAFDRYWSSAATVSSLNREIDAYARRSGVPRAGGESQPPSGE